MYELIHVMALIITCFVEACSVKKLEDKKQRISKILKSDVSFVMSLQQHFK